LIEAHALLLHEPWCLTVEQIAGLTAWQVEHLYLRPARERDERTKGIEKRESAPFPSDAELGEFVAAMLASFPTSEHPDSTPEYWTEQWHISEAARLASEGK
jgi:hypothetical protein